MIHKRSEEVSDIIERMPVRFGRWVGLAVLFFSFFILLFGWLIKYPDTIQGKITINSSKAPVKLIANSSGKLTLFYKNVQEQVVAGAYIGVIQNPANTEDIRYIMQLVKQFDINSDTLYSYKLLFPEKVSLGEINLRYFNFLTALNTICNYEKANIFEEEYKKLSEYIKWQKKLLQQTEKILQISHKQTNISQKWLLRNESLQKKDMISEANLDQTRNTYLSNCYNEENLKKECTSIRIQIGDAENKLKQLTIEKYDKENEMKMKLLSTYYDLTDQSKTWEQTYVFKAPFTGYLEFMKFWTNGEFVPSGEEVFSIVPFQEDIIGQVLLPASGAGKVDVGNDVIIKLDNYPYIEFGSIKGKVKSISLVTKKLKTETSNIETYLVIVSLPDGLTTNYGESLYFKYEIKGTAEIVVKKRRLIERLFDNLKYRIK